jgi:hypothetical protein
MREVWLDDGGIEYEKAEQRFQSAHLWAQKHCISYQKHEVVDVTDTSYTHDLIARYLFRDERDVVIFELRWS